MNFHSLLQLKYSMYVLCAVVASASSSSIKIKNKNFRSGYFTNAHPVEI